MSRVPSTTHHTLRLAAVLVAVFAVGLATPSIAAVVNADKVDGKDAVGAGASLSARAGNLVATNNAGRLPNNIVRKAPDANKLDGLNSTAFVRANRTLTETHTCAGTTFVPITSAAALSVINDAGLASDNDDVVRCNVELPTNAVVTSLAFTVRDSSGSAGLRCELFQQSRATGEIARIASATSQVNQPELVTVTDPTVLGNPVDAAHVYFAQCELGTTSDLTLYDAAVTYQRSVAGTPLP